MKVTHAIKSEERIFAILCADDNYMVELVTPALSLLEAEFGDHFVVKDMQGVFASLAESGMIVEKLEQPLEFFQDQDIN